MQPCTLHAGIGSLEGILNKAQQTQEAIDSGDKGQYNGDKGLHNGEESSV